MDTLTASLCLPSVGSDDPRQWRHRLRPPVTLGLILLVCAGCAAAPPVRLDEGRVQEPLRDLETYVLDDSAKFRDVLERSGAIYEDPQLEAYVNGLVQPLIPQLPASSRYQFSLKVVRDPTLNAYTLGDGAIYFNTGLIARLKTKEQFAFVMGHEIAHVMNRDLVYFTDSLHRKTITAKLTGLVVTPALSALGLGSLGDLGVGLAYAASVTGYGRQREAKADEESLLTMRRLGYDEREALRVFEAFAAEHDRYQRGIELSFLSSHPSNEARLKAVKTFMGAKALDVFAPEQADDAFLDATQRLRVDNAAFNIQLGRPYHAVEDLQIILRRTPHDAHAHFYLAEAYRLIADDPRQLRDELNPKSWQDIRAIAKKAQQAYCQNRAQEEYREALAAAPQFADPYRGLGLLQLAQGRQQDALGNLQRYLDLSPNAKDRRFVTSLMDRHHDAARSPPP